MSMKNSKLYCCYSVPLKNYLAENNMRYELSGKHPVTDFMFWVYVRTEELNKYLSNWSRSNK